MAERDPGELDVAPHPAFGDGRSQRVPEGVESCVLEPPCPHCKSSNGYDDTRHGTIFCARCGRNVRRRALDT